MVREFRREYRFLSNFYPSNISVPEIGNFMSVEHFYQSFKDPDNLEYQKECRSFSSPGYIKRLSRTVNRRSDWDEVKIDIMTMGVELKFYQNPVLSHKLVATGDVLLQEGNTWGDVFWGVDLKTGKGENRLGQILMDVRQKVSLLYPLPSSEE